MNEPPAEWIANVKSGLVHAGDCEYGLETAPENREDFETLYDALGAGFMEAGCCLTDHPFKDYK